MTKAVELAQIASTGVSEAFKNRIINGAMVIDQRGSAASPVTVGSRAYAVDRWCAEKSGTSGVFTFGQSSVAPAGFTNSFLCTVTTADGSVAAGDIAWFEHHVEGYNIADLGWGTADAKTITLSFWCRSSLAGTYSVVAQGGPNYSANYTISSANTWEYKTITIPGPTSGSWNTTTSTGVKFRFALMAGSNYQLAPGTWTGGDYIGSTSQVNWMATNGNTFYLTGVQLEVGSSATSFEYRDYGNELRMCQRYYNKMNLQTYTGFVGWCDSSSEFIAMVSFPVTMRTDATFTSTGYGAALVIRKGGAPATINTTNLYATSAGNCTARLYATVSSGLTTGAAGAIAVQDGYTAYMAWSAEL